MSDDENHTLLERLRRSKDPKMSEQVEEVRRQALARIEESPNEYDKSDVERLKQNSDETNWTIERFIRMKNNVHDASEMLINTLKFRQQYLIPTVKPEDFPEEFYKIGAIFSFEPDLAGNGTIYLRVRLHRKVKEMEFFAKQFILFIINQADEAVNGTGLTIVFDCSGAGISNLDMDFVWFLIDSVIKYYPIGIQHIIVYEMPWILSSAWTIIKGWMPEEFREKIVFSNRNSITKFISIDNLPYYMNGNSLRDYHFVPKGCRSSMEISLEQGIYSEKEVKKINKVYQTIS